MSSIFTTSSANTTPRDHSLLPVTGIVVVLHGLLIIWSLLMSPTEKKQLPPPPRLVVQTITLSPQNQTSTIAVKEISAKETLEQRPSIIKEPLPPSQTPPSKTEASEIIPAETIKQKALEQSPEEVVKEKTPQNKSKEEKVKPLPKPAPAPTPPKQKELKPKESKPKEQKSPPKEIPKTQPISQPEKKTPPIKPTPKKNPEKSPPSPPQPQKKTPVSQEKKKLPEKQGPTEAEKAAAAVQKKKETEQEAAIKLRRQTLLAQAQESIAKIPQGNGKLNHGKPMSDLSHPTPLGITSLQIDAIAVDQGVKLSDHEISYRDELANRLKLLLRLPDYGEVKIKLTIARSGKVVKVLIIKAESTANRKYVEETLPGLTFSPFGTRFNHAEENTFLIDLLRN